MLDSRTSVQAYQIQQPRVLLALDHFVTSSNCRTRPADCRDTISAASGRSSAQSVCFSPCPRSEVSRILRIYLLARSLRQSGGSPPEFCHRCMTIFGFLFATQDGVQLNELAYCLLFSRRQHASSKHTMHHLGFGLLQSHLLNGRYRTVRPPHLHTAKTRAWL